MIGLSLGLFVPPGPESRIRTMQAFRNAAKPLMVVVALTFFAWLVVDLSGITGSTGLLTKTSVGKVNGRSIDARTYQTVVQQNIDARQRQAPGGAGARGLRAGPERGLGAVRPEQRARRRVPPARHHGQRRRDRRGACGTRRRPSSRRSPSSRPTASSTWPSTSAGSRRAWPSSTCRRLEAQYREQLQRSKLLRVVTADIYLSDAALWEQYRDENEKVKIGLDRHHPAERRPGLGGHAERRRDRRVLQGAPGRLQAAARRRISASWRCPGSRPPPIPRPPARARIRCARRSWAARRSPTWPGASRPTASSAAHGRRPGRVDPGQHGSRPSTRRRSRCRSTRSRSRCCSPVRLPPDRDHQPEGQQGQGPAHPHSRSRWPARIATSSMPRPTASRSWAPSKTDPAALDTVARALKLHDRRSRCPVQEGTKVQLGQSRRARRRRLGLRRPSRAPTSPVIETPLAYYVFRLDSLQAGGRACRWPRSAQRSQPRRARSKKVELARKMAEDYVKRVEAGGTMAPWPTR